jgi:hypothetical protein
MARRVLFTILVLLVGVASVGAQSAEEGTTVFVRNWTRAELWRFFEPRPGGGDPTYADVANRLQVGLRRVTTRYEFLGAVQYVQFGGLPRDASGPGALGVGAVYFAHSGRTDSRQAYLRYLNLRVKEIVPGLSVQLGRMAYTEGGDVGSGRAKVGAVKQERATSRMIGEFEWSIYQRGFDGLRLDWNRSRWQVSVSALRPTQGGFEDAAGLRIDKIGLLTATLDVPHGLVPNSDVQLSFHRYDDRRAVSERPDNTARPALRADVQISSFGATVVGAYPLQSGELDTLVWLAGQTGTWYEQSHGGFGFAAELGHQWTRAPGRPWLRGGMLRASGDPDPGDQDHETFFQMLPTIRKFSQSATYSLMNLSDVFVQALLSPTRQLSSRIDVHRVSLAESADRWYSGSGATQRAGTIFGFSGRPSQGATDLGTVIEGSANYVFTPHWSVNGYFGFIEGGDVVERTFAGDRLIFSYIENVFSF